MILLSQEENVLFINQAVPYFHGKFIFYDN